MENFQKLVVVCGPTASGKSALAVALAQIFNGEVVSADSMQIYRGMDVGTAKITPQEMQGVPHHMLDIAEPEEAFSAAKYQTLAQNCIADIAARGKLPILCGGTGLYIESLVYGHDQANAQPNAAFRAEMEQYAEKNGAIALHARLAEQNEEMAQEIHPNNVKRVVRALEILYSNGGKRPVATQRSARYKTAFVGLTLPRDVLYQRINQRVDKMMQDGLEQEVLALQQRFGAGCTALQAIGYKELICCFNGNISRQEAIEQIKQESRRYAKRQLTWFRNREKQVYWLDSSTYENFAMLVQEAKRYIEQKLEWE